LNLSRRSTHFEVSILFKEIIIKKKNENKKKNSRKYQIELEIIDGI